MSEWNLSVRLTGQGSDLKQTLKDSASEARKLKNRIKEAREELALLRTAAADDITVRLDVDAAHLRSDVTTAVTGAGNGQGIAVRLDIDAGHLRDDVSAALTSAGSGQGLSVRLDLDADHLRSEVTSALTAAGSGQGLAVNLHLGNAMQLRREVSDAVRWAQMGHRIQIPIGLADPMQLRRDVSAAVRWASMNQTITVRVQPDTSALRGLGGTLGGGPGGGSGGADFGLAGLLPIATAAIPLIAGLTSSLAPLAGMFAATGGAATAFGIALAGQIGPLGDVADAEKKYQEAVRDNGRASKEAMEAQLAYQKQLTALPPETQKAAVALSSLKTTFGDWSDDMATWTMEPVTKSFTVLEQLLPHTSREVQSFSGSMDRLLDVAGGAISTPGFDAFSGRVADLVDVKLDDFTDGVIHLLRVVSQGDADAGTVGKILTYFRENGPAAREALNAIGDAIGTLVEGAAQAGPTMLTLVTAAARLVAALPPELVAIILQTATALKLLQLSGAGMAALAGGIGTVRAAIAGLAATSAAAGGGLAGLRAAFLALGTATKASVVVAGIALVAVAVSKLMDIGKEAPPNVDKLTSSLKQLGSTGEVTGEAARAFGDDLSGLYDKVQALTDPSTADDVQQFIVSLGGIADWDSTPVKEAKENLDAIDESLANLVKGGRADLAAEALKRLTAEYGKGGRDTSELTKNLDAYQSAIEDAKFEQELAAQSMGLFGKAAQETQGKLEAQKASADGLRQSIQALNDVNRAAGSAMSAFEQSIDDATAAVKDHQGALKLRDGELDLGSQKARDAEKVLSELAANTDAAATAAREQGKSWEDVNGIFTRGREAFIKSADAMGLTAEQAAILADQYLKIPDKKTTVMEMRTEDAISGLDSVIAAIEKTPDAKSVTVNALTSDAQSLLESLGFKVEALPDGRFKVSAETGSAESNLQALKGTRDGLQDKTITLSAAISDAITDLEAVKAKVASTNGKTITMKAPTAEARKQLEALGYKIKSTKGKNVVISVPTGTQRSNVSSLAGAIANLRNKSVTVTYTTVYRIQGKPGGPPSGTYYGSTAGRSADGNIYGGARVQRFADGGTRENHVAQIAQPTYRMWAEPETGGEAYIPFAASKRPRSRAIAEETVRRLGGDPASIDWYASGGVTGWNYDPNTGSLYSASDAGRAGHKTKKVKGKDVDYFDVSAVERKLWDLGKANVAWSRNLEKVAARAGTDVAEALAAMGEDGVKIAAKMATGTDKYVASMSMALRNLEYTARASLKAFATDLNHVFGNQGVFESNLAQLAAQGYGALATRLAAQNDQAAYELAAEATRDKSTAAKANAAAKKAETALTPEQISQLVAIIAAISTKTTGIHDVAGKTGLGEDEIIDVGNKAKSQITKALGSRADRFIADLGKANKGMAYADGGIRAGMYATRGGIIRFAEPETHGEAYLPLSPSKRRTALPVLADVANRFGVGLTDASAGRPVVIVQHGDTTQVTVTPVRTGATATDIAAQVGRSVRRARRGGVAARAA
ncbi:hypothetical protein KVH31_34595 [Streptomyces olivaceus]|uniref:hypothetical protein n=1 Tax=Streptomyces olivaceus TaxID=47716 RepID=UPI001CCC995D|nr:hypothetical protein [Streptomyces olivaceus]MBZ6211627.1 hypothetical protein [Streptomyces olivaceus]